MATPAQIWFVAYTRARVKALRESSQKVYGAWWNRYVDFLDERGRTPVAASSDDVRAFLGGYSGNTPIRYCRLLVDVYDAAVGAGLAKGNPVRAVEPEFVFKEEERVSVPAVTVNAVQALYSIKPTTSHWKGARDRALVLLSADAGLRRHELLNLQLNDLLLDSVPPTVAGHAGKERKVVLSLEVRDVLAAWLETREEQKLKGRLVFPANPNGDGLDPSTVYRIIERHLARIGAGKQGAHKTSGAQLLRAGVAARLNTGEDNSQAVVQHTLGHRQAMSTVDLLGRLNPIEQQASRDEAP